MYMVIEGNLIKPIWVNEKNLLSKETAQIYITWQINLVKQRYHSAGQ